MPVHHDVDTRVCCRLIDILFILALTAPLALCASSSSVGMDPVALNVHFTLTDLDYKPIPDVAVRVTFGSDPRWQSADSGERFVTDANGEHRFTASVVIDKLARKLPTNFLDSVFSRSKLTDHLMVATELEYATYHWLYTVDLYRFPGGDPVMLDGTAVYTRDATGAFTSKAHLDEGGWRMAELNGLVLTTPGHEPWDYSLQPDDGDPAQQKWTLKLSFKRSPPPIRR
jgi:hypothetical protein